MDDDLMQAATESWDVRAIPESPRAQKASPPMPPEARLEMPTQSLASLRRVRGQEPKRKIANSLGTRLARLFVFGAALALTIYGETQMYGVVNVGAITPLKWALLILFVANFSWIALACSSSAAGLLWLVFRSEKPTRPQSLTARTAVVMPIYNESASRVCGALQAMIEDARGTGLAQNFDWFLLSDTTNPDLWIAEERAFLSLRERVEPKERVYYRHRPKNANRKAGNISDFVTHWGGAYDHMLVLDADSLMTGRAVVALAAAMERDPNAGIIQSLPLIINRNTMFARLQQFAARIYGPIVAAGLAIWAGRDGNYWGHNAIIRVSAFAAHCGLPHLSGRPPFGGHILSHDFVEAALMRRAGYSVYMLPTLTGSYEESPPSLIDLAARDRRWCQGNLQHLRILPAKGLKLATRQHLATGIMAYLASPLWMAQLLVGIALVLQAAYIRPEYFTDEFRLFPAWPRFDAERALHLFGATMTVLLAPKFFGLAAALLRARTRRACGGALRLILSALLEILMSALVAPIMMVIQTGSVVQIVFGRDTGWNPQRRDDGSIPFRSILRRHRSHMALGLITLVAGLMISPSLAAWMSPTIAGLILAVPISAISGQLYLGLALKRLGLLLTPEEGETPSVVNRANELAAELAASGQDVADSIRTLHADADFRAQHDLFIPVRERRRRGEIDPDRALAEAKLSEAECVDEAVKWLNPKERMFVLHDRALIDLLARLPDKAPARESIQEIDEPPVERSASRA
jgi:membrane glycosyltransferase